MFKPMTEVAASRTVDLYVDGRLIQANPDQTLALALMQAGVSPIRYTAVSGAPRAPLCLMGVCFDCLVQVDGRANVQACMVQVSAGMKVVLQHGARALEPQA
jgi:predicted molibdopterin-dependent oxidoreductase YjgC